MNMKEIIVEQPVNRAFDPLNPETIEIENRLACLEIASDGKIQGVKPIKNSANKTLPANSGFKRIEGHTFILASQGHDAIVVVEEI